MGVSLSQADGEMDWTIPPELLTSTLQLSRLYHILSRGEKRNLEQHHIISEIEAEYIVHN
jgi:hypothetical protein